MAMIVNVDEHQTAEESRRSYTMPTFAQQRSDLELEGVYIGGSATYII
jgi:hypothetical protein